MSDPSSLPDRRAVLAASVFAGAAGLLPADLLAAASGISNHKENKMTATEIRPWKPTFNPSGATF